MPKGSAHKWEFKARFRRQAFGWRSQPAMLRIGQAVREIKRVARKDPVLAAEGAVSFLERISPALENIDGSSGAIGAAVNHAIAELVPVISGAATDDKTQTKWLERLYEAHAADQIPYIELLTDYWGELCASKEMASAWADRLLSITRMALGPDRKLRGHFHAASACLSSLFHAERYDELLEILETEGFWPFKRWAVKALVAQGRNEEAIRLAESCRSPGASDLDIDQLCEAILHSMGRTDEAYARYGIRAHLGGTYLASFRAVSRKYPDKRPAAILADLVKAHPGHEGKWFAAAKDAGLYEEALALASRTPCDPMTLARAARDHAESEPDFALGAGLLALHWLLEGYGYEISGADVLAAHAQTMKAAEKLGRVVEVERKILAMTQGKEGPVAETLRGGPGMRVV
jgi:hypothetical protein